MRKTCRIVPVTFILGIILFWADGYAICPELELMRDEMLTGQEKTFIVSFLFSEAPVRIGFETSFTELPNQTSLPVDGYIELDGKMVYSWKNRAFFSARASSEYTTTISSPGKHRIRLFINKPNVWVRFSITDYNCKMEEMREIESQVVQVSNLKEQIKSLPESQKKELLEWLQQIVQAK
jgi:hypothetical protein